MVININAATEYEEYRKYRETVKNAMKTKSELNSTKTELFGLREELDNMKELIKKLMEEKV